MERNSEGKATWGVVIGIVATVLTAVGSELLGSGLLSQWPTAVTVVGAILAVAKVVSDYTRSRPEKHRSMASKTMAEAELLRAKTESESGLLRDPT